MQLRILNPSWKSPDTCPLESIIYGSNGISEGTPLEPLADICKNNPITITRLDASGGPLGLVCTDIGTTSSLKLICSARTAEISIQSPLDSAPSYAFTARGTATSDNANIFSIVINTQNYNKMAALHVRILSLCQPNACSFYGIVLTSMTSDDTPVQIKPTVSKDSTWTSDELILQPLEIKATEQGSPLDPDQKVNGQKQTATVIAKAVASPKLEQKDHNLLSKEFPEALVEESQRDQIRMLLKHALDSEAGGLGLKDLPQSLSHLWTKAQAGLANNSFHTLASTLAKRALDPVPQIPSTMSQIPSKQHESGGASSGAEDGGSISSSYNFPLMKEVPSVLSSSLPSLSGGAMMSGVSTLLVSLQSSISRVEGLEQNLQLRLGTLDALCTSFGSLHCKLSAQLDHVDKMLMELEEKKCSYGGAERTSKQL